MTVDLTSDPIVTQQSVIDVLDMGDDADKAKFLINAVSARFLSYTNRERVTSGTVTQTDDCPPAAAPLLWLRAAPITSITSITRLYKGDDDETLSESDYSITLATGRLHLPNHAMSQVDYAYQIKTVYVGGWTTVPDDVQAGAMELIRLELSRLDGQAGVRSSSMGGVSSGLEPRNIPPSVADLWQNYRYIV